MSQTQTPTPQEVSEKLATTKTVLQTMSFDAAMKAVANGKKVARLEWDDGHIFMIQGVYHIVKENKNFQFILGDGDVLNDDWHIVE